MSNRDIILNELERMPVIDAHEHLMSEEDRLKLPVDALTMFSHYCRGDLVAAGMKPEQMEHVLFSGAPLDERWALYKPYYKRIRTTAYARAAHITLEKFYGETELNDDNIDTLSERVRANNTPGLYRRALQDACNIETSMNQETLDYVCGTHGGLLKPVMLLTIPRSAAALDDYEAKHGARIRTVSQLREAAQEQVRVAKERGAAGVKLVVFPFGKPDAAAAQRMMDERGADPGWSHDNPMANVFLDAVFRELPKHGLIACVHTGYWGDFRDLTPENMIQMADRYPDTVFDMYHVGYPYVREAIMLGKSRGNIYMNFCWTYIISPRFAADALDEAIEAVPLYKIIGFGGDYRYVEKVYGHLTMARGVIAGVLAAKVDAGWYTVEQAVDVARMILYENPKGLYGL